ncbi:MAG TPA: PaaX family transcriptional regulator C-terminal domain-containing protein, partial [Acidimicrobiales bacterium]|nr:PaaX family transcriptional regulator C-terminal domain-containing protein [Acidimicrobiales bacterium]
EDPPELPVAHLVRLARLFGISENRARVALSRMVAAGEATTDGAGRYRLAGRLLDRQERQLAGLSGWDGPWDGGWWFLVVRAVGRSAEERSGRRARLAGARFAECREGVWARPDNLPVPAAVAGDPDLLVLRAEPSGDGRRLAADLWDLDGWATKAEELRRRLEATPTLGPDDLAPGFVLSAAVVRHLVGDPLLPADLLPARWPGGSLRRTYDGWDRRYRDVLRAWGRAQEDGRGGDAPATRASPATA